MGLKDCINTLSNDFSSLWFCFSVLCTATPGRNSAAYLMIGDRSRYLVLSTVSSFRTSRSARPTRSCSLRNPRPAMISRTSSATKKK